MRVGRPEVIFTKSKVTRTWRGTISGSSSVDVQVYFGVHKYFDMEGYWQWVILGKSVGVQGYFCVPGYFDMEGYCQVILGKVELPWCT